MGGTREIAPSPGNQSCAHTHPCFPFPLLFRSSCLLVQYQPDSLQRRGHVAWFLHGWLGLCHSHADHQSKLPLLFTTFFIRLVVYCQHTIYYPSTVQ